MTNQLLTILYSVGLSASSDQYMFVFLKCFKNSEQNTEHPIHWRLSSQFIHSRHLIKSTTHSANNKTEGWIHQTTSASVSQHKNLGLVTSLHKPLGLVLKVTHLFYLFSCKTGQNFYFKSITYVTPPSPHHHTERVSNRRGRRVLYQGG